MNSGQLLFTFAIISLIVFPIGIVHVRTLAQPDLHIHNIDTGIDYFTIQEALDSAQTLDGHTILVDDGTYYEHVTINKAIRLIGASQDATIIDGNDTTQVVVSLTASNAEIANFTVKNGLWAIDLHNLENATVTENKMVNCSYRSMFLYHCLRSNVSNNTIISTTEAGIELWDSHEIEIASNFVTNTSHAIYLLDNSTKNILRNNFVTNNPQGLVLAINCNNNTVVGNTATLSNVGAIVMGGNHNNTIYHNNVINNPKPFFTYEGSSNFWDNGNEGNFWEDYHGADPTEDGVGDTPYTIDPQNQDNHPLMGFFNDFEAQWQEKTYHVHVVSNTTISEFDFRATNDTEPKKAIEFNVTGENSVAGFCRIMIPTALVNYTYSVLVDGIEVNCKVLNVSDETYAYLYFKYDTSTKHVIIVPEFPSAQVAFAFLILTLFSTTLFKNRLRRGHNYDKDSFSL
jgi:parallel beta-helix repeat protein